MKVQTITQYSEVVKEIEGLLSDLDITAENKSLEKTSRSSKRICQKRGRRCLILIKTK